MIQARYGWSDEYVLDLPYARFRQVARVSAEQAVDEERREWQRSAFVGWQSYLMQPLEKGKSHMSFREWLRNLGLEDAEHFGGEASAELSADEAIERANRIIQQAEEKGTRKVRGPRPGQRL